MHPPLEHLKSSNHLDDETADENGNEQQQQQPVSAAKTASKMSKFGLLIRTPRRRRANCLSQAQQQQQQQRDEDDTDQVDSPSTLSSLAARNRSKSWDSKAHPASTNHQQLDKSSSSSSGVGGGGRGQVTGKATWSGWRSLRKISDTLIDFALNETYKADSVFDDGSGSNGRSLHQHSNGVYRRRSELVISDASVRRIDAPTSSYQHLLQQASKTVGHAQGVSAKTHF